MNMKKILKGFTLIELLIVIAIIGVLAVAFLPTLLGAPSKGRDAARIADLQKIQKVLIARDLDGKSLPEAASEFAKIDSDNPEWAPLLPEMGGVLPSDPQRDKHYWYKDDVEYVISWDSSPPDLPVGNTETYDFGLLVLVENADNANAKCRVRGLGGSISPRLVAGSLGNPEDTNSGEFCYAILSNL